MNHSERPFSDFFRSFAVGSSSDSIEAKYADLCAIRWEQLLPADDDDDKEEVIDVTDKGRDTFPSARRRLSANGETAGLDSVGVPGALLPGRLFSAGHCNRWHLVEASGVECGGFGGGDVGCFIVLAGSVKRLHCPEAAVGHPTLARRCGGGLLASNIKLSRISVDLMSAMQEAQRVTTTREAALSLHLQFHRRVTFEDQVGEGGGLASGVAPLPTSASYIPTMVASRSSVLFEPATKDSNENQQSQVRDIPDLIKGNSYDHF